MDKIGRMKNIHYQKMGVVELKGLLYKKCYDAWETLDNFLKLQDDIAYHKLKYYLRQTRPEVATVKHLIEDIIQLEAETNLNARFVLATFSLGLYGWKQDSEIAFEIFSELAEKGHSYGELGLGFIYFLGEYGPPQDYLKSVNFYTNSSKRGNSQAMYNLALCYESGVGVTADKEKAFFWIQKAAFSRNPDALGQLGHYYMTGYGCKVDEMRGIEYFEKASELGNPIAMCNLALHRAGEKKYTEAFELYQKAANFGETNGQRYLDIAKKAHHAEYLEYLAIAKKKEEEARKMRVNNSQVLLLLLMARHYSPNCLLHMDYFPLELFLIVTRFADLENFIPPSKKPIVSKLSLWNAFSKKSSKKTKFADKKKG